MINRSEWEPWGRLAVEGAAGGGHDLGRYIDVEGAGCAAFEGVGGEAARIGEEVEHALAAGELLEIEAVGALIEEKAGLLAAIEVGVEARTVLFDFDEFGRCFAG